MTTWRENADLVRRYMKASLIQHFRKQLKEMLPNAAQLMQIADAMPEPRPGYTAEVGVSGPELAARLYRDDDWRGVAFWDIRELDPEFAKAYLKAQHGDTAQLVEYLKAEKPLGPKESKRLAELFSKKQRPGRPHNRQIRAAAELARFFYRMLRELNKESGIRDHGQSDNMKLYAARVIVEDWFSHEGELSAENIESFAQRVCEIWDKASSYREAGKPGTVTFPANWVLDLPPETEG